MAPVLPSWCTRYKPENRQYGYPDQVHATSVAFVGQSDAIEVASTLLAARLLVFRSEITKMESRKFENSRVSEGTLRSDAAADSQISNMIAEGGPASQAGAEAPAIPAGMRDGARAVSSASTLMGRPVLTATGEELGHIEEIMLDLRSGRIAYAVLSFRGFPGVADKRFPVPWNALRIDAGDFILDVDQNTFERAPDFDKDNWPDMSDPAFGRALHRHYGQPPYWEPATVGAGNRPEMRH